MKELELKTDKIFPNEKMKNHCTFKIGGAAFLYVETQFLSDIKTLIKYSKKINKKIYFIGLGANILFSSDYIDAIFVKYTKQYIKINKNKCLCSSGVNINNVIKLAYDKSLSNLEFLTGIPSTVGGAVVGNIGGVTESFGDIIDYVEVYDETLKTKKFTKKQCCFEYRNSIFSCGNYFIKSVSLLLKKSSKKLIKEKMMSYVEAKIKTQPLNLPSPGSTFKRHGNFIPAYHIDKLGLKGLSVGGAAISTKHSGFIINTGKATSRDVLSLIKKIQDTIFDTYKIVLECEIKYIK